MGGVEIEVNPTVFKCINTKNKVSKRGFYSL